MTDATTPVHTPSWHRNSLLAGGGLALAGLGLAAGMLLHDPTPSAANSSAQQPLMAASAAAEATDARTNRDTPAPVVHKHVPSHVASNERIVTSRSDTMTQPVAVCATCGVIESVHAVQQRGQGTGLGAVAGGVLGGVVGNQVGKGQGNAAMTVLGALGGGYVGNEVEKTQRANTVYDVRVRMNDGSVRTFTQRTEPVVGTHVRIDGDTLRMSE